ncbi:carbohydrate binding domain-containing protein [Solibacillus sp. FSL W7-1324]|uniref:carbohydrate binding domain-containing protein n=1 Tax=Solibacillus sp. FSL W7-1324 TaxID=2921701 RepID=UPI0030FC605F
MFSQLFIKGFKLIIVAVMVLTVSLGFSNLSYANDENVVAQLKNRGFKEPVNLGVWASEVVLINAVFGREDGKDVVYSTANGGIFNIVDVQTNELLFSKQMDNISQVWSHSISKDGTVFIAALTNTNVGEVWSYSPQTKQLSKLGTPNADHQLWSSTTDEAGNLYVGSYAEGNGRIFKYDSAAKQFIDLGKIDDGAASYVRSLEYYEGYLYAGLGVSGKVYRINATTFEKEDITKNVPEIIGKPVEEVNFAYDMSIVGQYLVTRFDEGKEGAILIYNLQTQQWVEDFKLGKLHDGSIDDVGSFGFIQLPSKDNKMYVVHNREFVEVDMTTLEIRRTGISYAAGLRGGAILQFNTTELPGDSIVTMSRLGQLVVANLQTGKSQTLPGVMVASPLKLHNLGEGPDGNLYMTTYPGGPKGSRFNTKTNQFVTYSQGQAEGIIAGNNSDLYFGIYPGAVIQKMNTDTLASETLFELKTDYNQDRPYIMKFEDNKLLIGTIPNYQKLGGSLTIFDTTTNERNTYTNIVKDQSIVGLAMHNGKIYGSTTIRGGLDINPTASEAKLFIWDIAEERVIKETELAIDELDAPPMISGLTFGPDDLLWGAVDGIIFALNPETLDVVKYKNLYPSIKNRGMWRPVHIEFGKDGLLYTDVAGKLTVIDPETMDSVSLISNGPEIDFMVLAEDAAGNENIYYIDATATHLYMIPVVEGGQVVTPEIPEMETIYVEIENSSFEEPVIDNKISGWSSLFGTFSPNAMFEVSSVRAHSGENSLKIVDTAQNETVFAQSDLIPIDAGQTYTASTKLFLEDGSATLLFRYYDENGVQTGTDIDNESIIHVRGGHKEWQTVQAVVTAPAEAKYARIHVGTSNYFTTNGAYFDDMQLTFEREKVSTPEEPEQPVKPGKGNQPEKPGKGNQSDKPGKGNQPEKPGKGNQPDKPGKGNN